MIVIGEKINASRKPIAEAIARRDEEAIAKVAAEQVQAGADYIDVNAGLQAGPKEAENMAWLVDVVQGAVDAGLCIDSADPTAMKIGLEAAQGKAILNSISLETERLEGMLPLLAGRQCSVIALLVSDEGVPESAEQRLSRAEKLIGRLTDAGKSLDEIIIDPCFLPLSTDSTSALGVLAGISEMRRRWPQVHICGGVSNASYGLPKRKYLNMALIVQAVAAGMDYGIIDPCVEGTMGLIHAAEVIAGRDEMCMNYISAARQGRLT